MISIKKEELVRSLLDGGTSDKGIAREADVSADTVARVRRTCEAVKALHENEKADIRKLLRSDIPASQISARLRVPVRLVQEMQRFDRLERPEDSPAATCPKCGGMIFPPLDRNQPPPQRKKMRGHISRDNIRSLGDVVLDLIQLGDLELITNPLFYQLSQRAEKVYEKIHRKAKDAVKSRPVKRCGGAEQKEVDRVPVAR